MYIYVYEYLYNILINRAGGLCGGIFCPRSLYRQRRFAEVCAKTEGKMSSIQTDQARLISILLNGYIYNGNGNDMKSKNHSKSFNGAYDIDEHLNLNFQDQSKQRHSSSDSLSFIRRHFLWAGDATHTELEPEMYSIPLNACCCK